MSNSSNSTVFVDTSSCLYLLAHDPTVQFWDSLNWYVFTLIIFVHVFGIIGNVICLLAFIKQVKDGQPYYQQLSVIVCDTANCVANIIAQSGYIYLKLYSNEAPKFIQTSFVFIKLIHNSYHVSMSLMEPHNLYFFLLVWKDVIVFITH